ncbi:DNA-binding domain-containing protein [Thiolinea disciformis]|uniref:HvfC/BufC N-terminal domain-containing protein n=1 Tax=Thiolinea disciformis TaxID=125614 RepID=UPI0003785B33|nr:putative DNA-binding domain-containing protein [Thiolinea disciformis]
MYLAELQSQFANALFDEDKISATAKVVKTQGSLSAEQRVGIYRHSVQGILSDYLSSLYPVTKQLVGTDFFEQVTERYIDHTPPTSPHLADYGDSFSQYLLTIPTLADWPWIAALTELEWARQRAWHSINQANTDFSQIAHLSEQQQTMLRFQLPHSAHLLSSPYAIHAIWLAHQAEDLPEKCALEAVELHKPCTLLIYRSGRRLYQQPLNPMEAIFVETLQAQKTFPELAEQFQDDLPTLLTRALEQQWIVSFSV